MTRRAREIETLLLTMYAAVPLYVTGAISRVPLVLFHLAMTAIVLRVARGKGPDLLPPRIMHGLALAYVPLYFVDWWFVSGSAIAASTHLVLFIAVYQPIEAMHRDNQSQRTLTTALIFVASVATSTHVTVALFVLVFAWLLFRQLIYVSHLESVRSIGRPYSEAPSGRAAGFYLLGAVAIGIVLFPLLPRVRNPLASGMVGVLPGASSTLSESIDFSEPRVASNDAAVVARVWLERSARDIFAPVRLRGMIYDRYAGGEWRQTQRGLREIASPGGVVRIARPEGPEQDAIIQIKAQRGKLFLPVGTYSVAGINGRFFEGPTRDAYFMYSEGLMNLGLRLAYQTEPLRLTRVNPVPYPVSPEIAALAREIVGAETDPTRQAALIERYMVNNFRYVPNGSEMQRTMPIDEFLLRDRGGNCEYFAAGMTVLLTALEIPARIAGGYYGGRLNPLTGYYTIRRQDAHAWTEMWDGERWVTFDATPASLRPGTDTANMIGEYMAALSDSITFVWDRYVLTFGLGDQVVLAEEIMAWVRTTATQLRAGFASNLGAIASPAFLLLLLLVLAGGALAVVTARRRRPLFDLLAQHLGARGIEVGPAMTMEEALRQLRAEQPLVARELEPLIALYEEERFSPRHDRERVALIRRKLAELG
jgi:transglutaminase-like putative cysteine protease